MPVQMTAHAKLRTQQRGISAQMTNWLVSYGDKVYDGRGGLIRFFSQRVLRKLEGKLDPESFQQILKNRRCYLVLSASDGAVITVGKLFSGRRVRH